MQPAPSRLLSPQTNPRSIENTSVKSGTSSPCSNRSVITHGAKAFVLAMACSAWAHNSARKTCSSVRHRLFSKQYLEPGMVAAQRTKGYWLDQTRKTVQLSKSAKTFNHFLFGNKSVHYFQHFRHPLRVLIRWAYTPRTYVLGATFGQTLVLC